jgi:hypothetical protein
MVKLSKNSAPFIILFLLLFSVLATAPAALAEAGTNVSGVINSDTVWTKSGSPYGFTGNVLVNSGFSLTIQSGVIVNFNGHYLRINGTLSAQGTPDSNIIFNIATNVLDGNAAIQFSRSSTSWNENTQSGSILQYVDITSTWELYPTIQIQSVSPKINNNTISSTNTLSDNIAIQVDGLVAPLISNNTIKGQITANAGNICNNTILSANLAGLWLTGNTTAIGNIIFGCEKGILATTSNENYPSSSLILSNLLYGNTQGIELEIYSYNYPRSITVQNNTLSNNHIGVMISSNSGAATYSISNNNIYNNTDNNLLLANNINQDFNATCNWWGVTDTQVIDQKIWDFNDNFNLGVVKYLPFLNSSNPFAPVYSPRSNPVSTPSPTSTSSPTPTPRPSPTVSPSLAPTTHPTTTPSLTTLPTNHPTTQPTVAPSPTTSPPQTTSLITLS